MVIKMKKYSKLRGKRIRAIGVITINLKNLDGAISYGGFIR